MIWVVSIILKNRARPIVYLLSEPEKATNHQLSQATTPYGKKSHTIHNQFTLSQPIHKPFTQLKLQERKETEAKKKAQPFLVFRLSIPGHPALIVCLPKFSFAPLCGGTVMEREAREEKSCCLTQSRLPPLVRQDEATATPTAIVTPPHPSQAIVLS